MALVLVLLFTFLSMYVVADAGADLIPVAYGQRESTLSGMCFQSNILDGSTLKALRQKIVKFNLRKTYDMHTLNAG